MSKVRSKDSRIEMKLRRAFWRAGLRYRLHVKSLPGTPDIVFLRHRVAVFVDSEFWHGYEWESRKSRIGTNQEFWIAKIEATMARDTQNTGDLRSAGWKVLRFWGKEVEKEPERCVQLTACALVPERTIKPTELR